MPERGVIFPQPLINDNTPNQESSQYVDTGSRYFPIAGDGGGAVAPSNLATVERIYHSYAGVDIVAQIVTADNKPLILGELSTISYSIHRENSPVRTLGMVNPCGFIKGHRTIAGSLIFTAFDRYLFYRLQSMKEAMSEGFQYPLADMMPPFDIVLTFANEYASFSKMKIFGVSIIDEGQTMSVDDMVTEQTMTYIARGIAPMVKMSPNTSSTNSSAVTSFTLR